ncbi:hypothetical protein [Pedobacter sp. SL55]|uniref:hypothetical protein n=1 Tax=Pedobacter sp. SL55 TaxID=2995161 RepID=UPI0022707D4C|nr:hypothetical protein [Pedobacter sp. SL55]WAC41529.1 hypothetical protein OVA16_03975 [Pedobacter sp. SL55]
MKKKFLMLSVFAVLATSVFAGELVNNTCKLSFNFLGIVKIWSGEKTYVTTDYLGNTYTYTTGCGEDGGSWDWFWE